MNAKQKRAKRKNVKQKNTLQKNAQRQKSLAQVYFDEWELPVGVFLSVAVLMILIGSKLADPVLQESAIAILMVLPALSSLGIAIAAVANLGQKKVKVGSANLFTFIVSLAGLLILFAWLCYMGMSY